MHERLSQKYWILTIMLKDIILDGQSIEIEA